MKIVHVCMNVPYMDGWGYQENLLPQYLYKEGVESVVVSSDKLPPHYLNGHHYPIGERYIDGVKVIRIKCRRIKKALTFTRGLYKTLVKENPDVIMHHNPNFTSLPICSMYCMKHNIKMIVDNHADYINSVQSPIYRFVFYRLMVGTITNLFSKPILKYYGVSYSRCDFLEKVFGVRKKKIEFLPIGIDDDHVGTLPSRDELRKKYDFQEGTIVVITGGKMGKGKGTDSLIDAVGTLYNQGYPIHLVLFGIFEDAETEGIAKSKDYLSLYGWCDRVKTLELLKAADLACWPIHHTTLCEDAIACGTPLMIRKTGTTQHLIEGNGIFLQEGTKKELQQQLDYFLHMNKEEKNNMETAIVAMQEKLSYHTIAKRIISDVSKT